MRIICDGQDMALKDFLHFNDMDMETFDTLPRDEEFMINSWEYEIRTMDDLTKLPNKYFEFTDIVPTTVTEKKVNYRFLINGKTISAGKASAHFRIKGCFFVKNVKDAKSLKINGELVEVKRVKKHQYFTVTCPNKTRHEGLRIKQVTELIEKDASKLFHAFNGTNKAAINGYLVVKEDREIK